MSFQYLTRLEQLDMSRHDALLITSLICQLPYFVRNLHLLHKKFCSFANKHLFKFKTLMFLMVLYEMISTQITNHLLHDSCRALLFGSPRSIHLSFFICCSTVFAHSFICLFDLIVILSIVVTYD